MKVSLIATLFLLTISIPGFGQITLNDTARSEVVPPKWADDSLGRRSPRGTVQGFIRAVADENYQRAALYLHMDRSLRRKRNGEKLAQALQQLLDKYSSVSPSALISNQPDGQQDDKLGPNIDRIGSVTFNNESFDIMLESIQDKEGGPIWLFSTQTLERIPDELEEAPVAPLISKIIPQVLLEKKWGGVPIGHWLISVILVVAAYFLAWCITKFMLFLIPKVWAKARIEPTSGVIKAFSVPVQIYLSVWYFVYATEQADISIIVRQRLSGISVVFYLIALMLLLWQLLDTLTGFTQRRFSLRGNQAGVSAVLFLRRALKITLVVIAVIAALDTFGFNVTTGLAALGIGGIALALGAQKTVENFVGSVTLIADQPVRIGDFCKVGDIVGTVEQIGMRSTQIRTNDRTVVTIPNGEFAALKIENFAHRDRFFFHPVFRIRLDATPDQIRYLLVELRAILYAHPKVSPQPARIRFIEIGTDALKLEVFSYIIAVDFDRFLEIQEDIYLRMLDVIKASGTALALPSQTLYLGKDQAPSPETADAIKATVDAWRETNDMQIPNFDPAYLKKIKHTIQYPPEGSSSHKKG
ncbi:mechanosensitive ion channel family protein [Olivibacter sp. XZL3]|uniref:mechanosensitive ion channel family protein n=1 Tax=Olivibacter sp. XZL3 TaxID=1735116 RepID=UPI001065CA8B|nr:mechanosensitive ion channel family protein [Olivibacter sp. XZL3]